MKLVGAKQYVKKIKLEKHPLEGCDCLEFPIERHLFTFNPKDDYRCLICNRPRALHIDTETTQHENKEQALPA